VTSAPPWARRLADEHCADAAHGAQCEGTLRYISAEARLRGVQAVRRGECLSLSRPVRPGKSVRPNETRPTFAIQTFARTSSTGRSTGSDRVEFDCHGMANTHLDGLTHVGYDGHWHNGSPTVAPPFDGSADMLIGAASGIATRAICLDIAAGRGVPYIGLEPVDGAEMDRAVAAARVEVLAGDAVLVHMGRDGFERPGADYGPIGDHPGGRPGLGRDAAEWIADHRISVLCWDFLDAHLPGVESDVLPVHTLIWAIGLVLIDNCHLGPAARGLVAAGAGAGLLAIGPLQIRGATGSLANPIFMF
jgi:kynurenine formamidase